MHTVARQLGTGSGGSTVEVNVKPLAALVVAMLGVVGCGTDARIAAIPTISVDASPPPLTTEPASAAYTANTVASVEQIGSVPFDIRPLPDGEAPALSADEVMARIVEGDFGFFFARAEDRNSASIKVGLISDHSISGTPAEGPTFPGYVILGGHSTCIWSGPSPAPPETLDDRRGPCHAEIVVDGDTGEIRATSQISG